MWNSGLNMKICEICSLRIWQIILFYLELRTLRKFRNNNLNNKKEDILNMSSYLKKNINFLEKAT